MARNPILNAGCYGILQSLQENTDSAVEDLNFSVSPTTLWELKHHPCVCKHTHLCLSLQDITVNQDFEDLHTAVKEIFPALKVKHGGRIGNVRKANMQASCWSCIFMSESTGRRFESFADVQLVENPHHFRMTTWCDLPKKQCEHSVLCNMVLMKWLNAGIQYRYWA